MTASSAVLPTVLETRERNRRRDLAHLFRLFGRPSTSTQNAAAGEGSALAAEVHRLDRAGPRMITIAGQLP